MPIALNTTLAAKDSNSYVEIQYCSDYWEGHWDQVKAQLWGALSTQQRTQLLIAACSVLETLRFTSSLGRRDGYPLHYDRRTRVVVQLPQELLPVKSYFYQRLQFPRNLDRDIYTGVLFIPEPIMTAQCEQAMYLLSFDDTALANRIQGVTQDMLYVGSIRTRQNYVSQGSSIAPLALEMIRPYLLSTSSQVRRQ